MVAGDNGALMPSGVALVAASLTMAALMKTWREDNRGDGSCSFSPSSSEVAEGERPMAVLSVRHTGPTFRSSSLPSTTGVERTEPNKSTWSEV